MTEKSRDWGVLFLGLGLIISGWAQNALAANQYATVNSVMTQPKSGVEGLSIDRGKLEIFEKIQGDEIQLHVQIRGSFSARDKQLVIYAVGDGESQEVIVDLDKNNQFDQKIPIRGKKTHMIIKSISIRGVIEQMDFDIEYDGEVPSARAWRFSPWGARLSGVLFTNSSGTMWSAMPAWTPSYGNQKFRFQGDLGIVPLKRLGGSYFFALEYGVSAAMKTVDRLWIEGLVGMQLWTDQFSHNPLIGGSLIYRFDRKILSMIEQISLGYSLFLTPNSNTHGIRLGVGFVF